MAPAQRTRVPDWERRTEIVTHVPCSQCPPAEAGPCEGQQPAHATQLVVPDWDGTKGAVLNVATEGALQKVDVWDAPAQRGRESQTGTVVPLP
jgi:hypothetical protein